VAKAGKCVTIVNKTSRALHQILYEKNHIHRIVSVAKLHHRGGCVMLKLVVGVLASAAMVGGAIAADLPRREPEPPPAPVAVGKAPIGKLPFGKGPVVARY
jgi:hypothetical protein